jgi:predicted PurR-regulated permease PerM
VTIIKHSKTPFYTKAAIFIVGILALFTILYIAQTIIVPIVFSIIIAILLHPVVNFFVRKKINRVLAIVITLTLTFLVIASFGVLLFSQASRFSESWPTLVENCTRLLKNSISWASGYFDINPLSIHDWINKTKDGIIIASNAALGQTLVNVGSAAIVLFLIPVYIFMLLFYEPLLLESIRRIFISSNQTNVSEIITQTKTVIQRYLVGLCIEAVIIATLNSISLLLLGIDYAIILGIIGAMVNVIPYIGGVVAVALPMMVALATKQTAWPALYVLIVYFIIQMADNHYIIPKIVASKVKLNALFSIIAVLAGNALWGIPGMLLSIPLLAIVKLIFDHIEPLKLWGFLLGDTMPPIIKINPFLKKIK